MAQGRSLASLSTPLSLLTQVSAIFRGYLSAGPFSFARRQASGCFSGRTKGLRHSSPSALVAYYQSCKGNVNFSNEYIAWTLQLLPVTRRLALGTVDETWGLWPAAIITETLVSYRGRVFCMGMLEESIKGCPPSITRSLKSIKAQSGVGL